MPACTTPLLWPVWCAPTSGSLSTTTSRRPGRAAQQLARDRQAEDPGADDGDVMGARCAVVPAGHRGRVRGPYPPSPRMRMLVTGASGAIGAELIPHLGQGGARAARLRPDARARLGPRGGARRGRPGRRGDRRRPRRGARGRRRRLLPHPLDGDRGRRGRRRGLRRARPARRRPPSREAARARRRAARGVPRRPRPGHRAAPRSTWPAAWRSRRSCLGGAPEAVALRASIVIGARSRSFRFLVRLVERVPFMPLPAWRDNRTQPIDGRDVLAYLAAAATSDAVDGPVSRRHRRTRRRHLRRAGRPHPRRPARRPARAAPAA